MIASSTSISASEFSIESSSSADSPHFKRPQEVETMCSEWTERMHHLYLKSLESSFINQLYRNEYGSTNLLDRPLKPDNRQTSQSLNANKLSYQFKVLRQGRWGKLNFKKQRSSANIINEHCFLTENKWIKHFRSSRIGKGQNHKISDASSREIYDENFVGIDLEEGEEQNEVTPKRARVEATNTQVKHE